MYITLSKSECVDELLRDENAGWSVEGAETLVNYLCNLEDDMGKQIEFCRVAIRCEFAEMHAYEFMNNDKEWREEAYIATLGNGKFLVNTEV